MDDYHNLLSYTYPPSPEGNNDSENIASNAPPQSFEVNSDAFISIPCNDPYGSYIVGVNVVQNHQTVIVSSCQCNIVPPNVNETERPLAKRFTG